MLKLEGASEWVSECLKKILLLIVGTFVSCLILLVPVFFLERLVEKIPTADVLILPLEVTLGAICFICVFWSRDLIRKYFYSETLFSWPFILLVAFLISPFLVNLITQQLDVLRGIEDSRILCHTLAVIFLPVYLVILFNSLYYLFYSGNVKKFLPAPKITFGPESIGSNPGDDKYDFTSLIKDRITELKSISKDVSVIALIGEIGQGKSSFVRMLAEELFKEDIPPLYTYLSLIEVNESENLLNLFAKRWTETLSERYPVARLSSAVNKIKVFTDSLNYTWLKFFHFVFDILENILGSRTRKRGIEKGFVNPEISNVFLGIPKIHEDIWLFAVEDLERATYEELFRLIEVIERIKMAAIHGFPIKIVFLLSYSATDLSESLDPDNSTRLSITKNIHGDSDVEGIVSLNSQKRISEIIYDFLFRLKTVGRYWLLPPEKRELKVANIRAKIASIVPNEAVLISDLDAVINPYRHQGVRSLLGDREVWGIAVHYLAKKTPRTIDRVLEGFITIVIKNGTDQNPVIRYCDLFMLELLKQCHPLIVSYLSNNLDSYTYHQDRLYANLKEYIASLGFDSEGVDTILDLLSCIALGIFSNLSNFENDERYPFSSSKPENLRLVLGDFSKSN